MNRRRFLQSAPLITPGTVFGIRAAASGPPRVSSERGRITLGNDLVSQTVDTAGGGLRLLALQNSRTGFDWAAPGRHCGIYFAAGRDHTIGLDLRSGFQFHQQGEMRLPKGALEHRLDLVRQSPATRISLFTTAFPDAAVIEYRCIIENIGREVLAGVSRFDPLCLWLRSDKGPLVANWVQGMRGSTSGQPDPEPYATLRVRRESLGETLRLTGGRRASELDAGWLGLENTRAGEILFVGIEWAGEWGLRVLRQDSSVLLTAGVINSRHDLAPGATLESPRIFVGVARGDLDAAVRASHHYLLQYVFPRRLENFPWVTYEPWLPMAANMEEAYWPEVEVAARLGVECFYIGPHWYQGSNQNLKDRNHNYTPGLGTWRENRERFPNGLGNFSKRVHDLGLKFGLWLEPERVDDRLVPSKIPESFLTKHNGLLQKRYVRDGNSFWDPPGAAVCLGNPEVVRWLQETLSKMVEDYEVDWIKWDNNFYEICDDPSHGHQAGNGNYAHMRGVYAVWAHLAKKFPDLVIENCAGGGNRMDFGLARYCRTNWLADSTAPSYRVRYHVEGASYLFPAPYLYSWIWTPRVGQKGAGDTLAMNLFMAGAQELVDRPHSAMFMDNLFRSRMLGACGIGLNGLASARASLWNEEVKHAARRNITHFKQYRHLFWEDLYHLTPQPALYVPDLNPPKSWEILEYAKADGSEAVILCFRGDTPQSQFTARPRGLALGGVYQIRSLNTGDVSTAPGAKLSRDGLTVEIAEQLGSEILMLRRT